MSDLKGFAVPNGDLAEIKVAIDEDGDVIIEQMGRLSVFIHRSSIDLFVKAVLALKSP